MPLPLNVITLSVVDSTSTIIINSGGKEVAVSKGLVTVANIGDNVLITWSPTDFVQCNFANVTAPSGASALAVKNSIEAFLDSGITVTVNSAFQYAEDSAFTNADIGAFILGVRNDTIETTLTSDDGDFGALAIDSAGRLGVRDNKAEDAAHSDGDIGSFILGVRNDTILNTLSGTDGDYTPLAVDGAGLLGTRDNHESDVASGVSQIGSAMLGVRNDAKANISTTDTNWSRISVDQQGRLLSAEITLINTASVTRPANATAYDAGDVVATTGGVSQITFSGIMKNIAESGIITGALLVDSVNSAGTKADFDLWLFDTAVADQADNVAFNPTDAEALTCRGVIRFLGADARTGTSNAVYEGTLQSPIAVSGIGATDDIIGVLIIRNAYTPVSGEIFTIRLRVIPQ